MNCTENGVSVVDVTISYKDGIVFIEAKYLVPVNLRTTSDPLRDQIIRYLDLGRITTSTIQIVSKRSILSLS